jgi:hypothetical protein
MVIYRWEILVGSAELWLVNLRVFVAAPRSGSNKSFGLSVMGGDSPSIQIVSKSVLKPVPKSCVFSNF